MDTSWRVPTRIRVLVADSSRIHTQLLSDILERDPDLELIPWDCNRATLVPTVAEQNVDVLAVSATLLGRVRDGLDVVRELSRIHPDTKVVVLVDATDDDLALEALRAGAKGIFSKDGLLDMLRKCLHVVHHGEIWLDSRILSLVITALASTSHLPVVRGKKLEKLSKREGQVVEWLAQGLSNREISDRMELSPHTVKNYVFRIFEKMGVSSRTELLSCLLTQNHGIAKPLPQSSKISDLITEAEKGSSVAQLALAEAYEIAHQTPEAIAKAYTWYSIVSERIRLARSVLVKDLTHREIEACDAEARFHSGRDSHSPEREGMPKPKKWSRKG